MFLILNRKKTKTQLKQSFILKSHWILKMSMCFLENLYFPWKNQEIRYPSFFK